MFKVIFQKDNSAPLEVVENVTQDEAYQLVATSKWTTLVQENGKRITYHKGELECISNPA